MFIVERTLHVSHSQEMNHRHRKSTLKSETERVDNIWIFQEIQASKKVSMENKNPFHLLSVWEMNIL